MNNYRSLLGGLYGLGLSIYSVIGIFQLAFDGYESVSDFYFYIALTYAVVFLASMWLATVELDGYFENKGIGGKDR
jgi:hypothetical protein